MHTGNTGGPVSNGQEGGERRRCKRRHDDDFNTPQHQKPPAKRRVASTTDGTHDDPIQPACDGTYGDAIQPDLTHISQAASPGDLGASVPRSASLAFANSEALRIGRLQADYMASVGRSMELSLYSRLANLGQSLPPVYEHGLQPSFCTTTWPVPHLQYRPILGFSSALLPSNAFAYSPLDSANPMYPMLVSTYSGRYVAGSTAISPRDASSSSGHVNAAQIPQCSASYPEIFPIDTGGASSSPVERSPTVANAAAREARPQKKERGDHPQIPTMTLHAPEDRDKLSKHQAFLRKQVEIFRATHDDILSITRGKNKPIVLQQVGLRCRHCSHIPAGGRTKGATYFPSTLMGVYQAAQNMCVEHFQSGRCTELPPSVRERFSTYTSVKNMASVVGKKYWAEGARNLGLVDTDDGIRFAADLN